MKTVFKYRREMTNERSIIYRPVAKIILCGPTEREVVEYMYIDSGADFTMIPYRLGIFIGLERNRQKVHDIRGVSGIVGVIYEKVMITIGKKSFSAKIAWAQIENVPLLLGRTDIFDKFKILFDQKKKSIIFEDI